MINPTHFDLQSLRLFLQVARIGSLTKTAAHFHMTLSALSKRMAELERTVDCVLFIRMPRGLALTAAGKELVHHARQVVNSVDRMAGEMQDYAVGVRGHVHIWANTSAIIEFLPQELADFLQRHPLVRINLEEKLSETVVTALLTGQADIGIFADNVPSPGVEKNALSGGSTGGVGLPSTSTRRLPGNPLRRHLAVRFRRPQRWQFLAKTVAGHR
ncbi:hypothetical protein OS12_03080 [Dickeya oryzae]